MKFGTLPFDLTGGGVEAPREVAPQTKAIGRPSAAGIPLTPDDIAGMGLGGRLSDIANRPRPRDPHAPGRKDARVHAVILAAGRSSRMGGPNKLLARFGGETLLRALAGRALASKATGVGVVTGHQAERIGDALAGLPLVTVHNSDYASGLASSLVAAIRAVPAEAAGALVMLGDMPGIETADLNRMIDAFQAGGGAVAVRATAEGKRGNPVILPRPLFAEIATLEGDTGARHILERGPVIDVELGERAGLDVDTPEALARAGGVLQD